jgi:hypothetical protein
MSPVDRLLAAIVEHDDGSTGRTQIIVQFVICVECSYSGYLARYHVKTTPASMLLSEFTECHDLFRDFWADGGSALDPQNFRNPSVKLSFVDSKMPGEIRQGYAGSKMLFYV